MHLNCINIEPFKKINFATFNSPYYTEKYKQKDNSTFFPTKVR